MRIKTIEKIRDVYKKLTYILTTQQKLIGLVVIVSALVSAVFELLGVSIIVPLINALLEPSKLRTGWPMEAIEKKVGYINDTKLTILIIVGVIIIYIIKNIVFCINSWVRLKYSYKIERECSLRMVSSYLRRGYEFFLNNNINELLQGSVGDISGLYYIISSIIQIVTQMVTIMAIAIYLIYSDWLIAIGVIVSASLCLLFLSAGFRKMVRESGIAIRKGSIQVNKVLMESFFGVKEVLAMNKQEFYIKEYERRNIDKQKHQIRQSVASEIPAYIIEAVCITGIMLVLCVRLISIEKPESFIVTLSTFAIGAFRILPGLGKISSSINIITSCIPSLNAIYKNIMQANEYEKEVKHEVLKPKDESELTDVIFVKDMELKNISYAYDYDKYGNVIEDVCLKIYKGDSIALIGETGAGKSTLGDIIIGLLNPQKGDVLLDGISIVSNPSKRARLIGFVPQAIYLSDTTIKNNVAFGEKETEINENRVIECLKKANVWTFVEKLPDGINTEIGERGVRLSGGQRQRIGIARALYHNPQILVLDEATSALDNETEEVVMEAIEQLQGSMTLIIIAHRLTTIRNCDRIYEIKNGHIYERSYDEL